MINGKKMINLTILALISAVLFLFAFFYPFHNQDKDSVKEKSSPSQPHSTPSVTPKKDFFIEYRCDRERLRSWQFAFLTKIMQDPSLDSAAKKEINGRLMKLNEMAEEELNIENMLKAKGYQEAMVIVQEDYVDVIIRDKALFSADVQAIGEIVVKNTGVNLENVVILSKP